jgi:hypothetical protein
MSEVAVFSPLSGGEYLHGGDPFPQRDPVDPIGGQKDSVEDIDSGEKAFSAVIHLAAIFDETEVVP